MAARFLSSRASLGLSRFYAPQLVVNCTSPTLRAIPKAAPASFRGQHRNRSVPKDELTLADSKNYTFNDVKSFTLNPHPSRILIDTREPSELLETGTIPTAINIPIKSQPDALFRVPDEFKDTFGFPMPSQDAELVFFCKAGVRSRTAAVFAQKAGWKKVGEYPGSWLDWEKQGGAKEPVK